MIEGILIGLQTALSFKNLMMVMIGCFSGTIIGMLPGLGPRKRNAWVNIYNPGSKFDSFLKKQTKEMTKLMKKLGVI